MSKHVIGLDGWSKIPQPRGQPQVLYRLPIYPGLVKSVSIKLIQATCCMKELSKTAHNQSKRITHMKHR